MCGIAGVVSLDRDLIDDGVLRRMTEAIAHRGPDGEGHYSRPGVGLGHRRLAIIDVTDAGRQPMATDDGELVIVHNGEVYNFRELRHELQVLGHRFRSATDTEVVLHAYAEWGCACVTRFNGMFAFAIHDRRGGSDRLFLARDRYGIKPLYYWERDRVVVFASEIKAILEHPRPRVAVNAQALSEYFTFQNVFSDVTLFEGVRILPPGCTMTVDVSRGVVGAPARYWDYAFSSAGFTLTLTEAAEETTRLFEQAVNRQLVSDVPLGSYLSGGIDSGSITAIASAAIPRMRTFTGGFDLSSASGLELGFDERPLSEMMANRFKTEHYEMVLHAGDMEHVLPELIWHLEDLRVGQCYPNYYIARLASRFVKVVLSGSGGDELFAGYPWRYYRGLPGSTDGFRHAYYEYWQRLVRDQDRASFFTEDAWRQVRRFEPEEIFRAVLPDVLSISTLEDAVNASLCFEIKTFLHGLFVVEDKLSMAHALETRVPFMDNDLVDFAQRVPASFKLRDLAHAPQIDEDEIGKRLRYGAQPSADGKRVLRQAISRFVPAQIAEGPKRGFSAPDASWFRGESIDYVNTLLGDKKARINEFVNRSYVARVLDEHTSGARNHRLLIWSLLSFEWWLRTFCA